MTTDDAKTRAADDAKTRADGRETIRQLRSEYEEIIQKLREEVAEWKRLAEGYEARVKEHEDAYWQHHRVASDRLSDNNGRAMIAIRAVNLVREALESQTPVNIVAIRIAGVVAQYDDAMREHDAAMLEKRHAIEREALEERHKKEREKLAEKQSTEFALKNFAPSEMKPTTSIGKNLP